MANRDHIVGRCRWNTSFDDQRMAHALQEKLSAWSNENLPYEIAKVLEELCPASQTWRINSLTIDLGSIEFQRLANELPHRFEHSFAKALKDLILKRQVDNQTIEVVEESGTWLDLMDEFLQNGSVPWWYSSDQGSVREIFEQLLSSHSAQLVVLVRRVGKNQNVRKRIVWQMGETLVRKLIQALEPHHSKDILEIADNLFELQQEEKIVQTDERTFRNNTMLWILDHLLVERGTLFNTVSFVKSTLRQMALHYNITFEALVGMVADAVETLEEKMQFSTVFIQAVLIVGKERKQEQAKQRIPTQEVNYWTTLESLLQTNASRQVVEGREVRLAELFSSLAVKDAAKMRDLILSLGQEEKTRKHLVAELDEPELEQLVKTIVPSDSAFVLSYAQHTLKATKSEKAEGYSSKTPSLIWEVILAYLIVDRGSRFNKKEFLRRTIMKLSAAHNLTYLSLLSLLTYQRFSVDGSPGLEPDLMYLLKDLTQDELNSTKGKQVFLNSQLQLFRSYVYGETPPSKAKQFYLPEKEELINTLLRLEPTRILAMLKQENAPRRTAHQLSETLSEAQLSMLLSVAGQELLAVVAAILELLSNSKSRSKAPWLAGNLSGIVHRLAIQYLLEHPVTMTRSELLWEYFVDGLARHFVVPTEEIMRIISTEEMDSLVDEAIAETAQNHSHTKTTATATSSASFFEVLKRVLAQKGVANESIEHSQKQLLQKLLLQPQLIAEARRLTSPAAQQDLWDELFEGGSQLYIATKTVLLGTIKEAAYLFEANAVDKVWLEELMWECGIEQAHGKNTDRFIASVIKGIAIKLHLDVLLLPILIKRLKKSALQGKVDWNKVLQELGLPVDQQKMEKVSSKKRWKQHLKGKVSSASIRLLIYEDVASLHTILESDKKVEQVAEQLAQAIELKLFISSLAEVVSPNDQKAIRFIQKLETWIGKAVSNNAMKQSLVAKLWSFVLYAWKQDTWQIKAIERLAIDLVDELETAGMTLQKAPTNFGIESTELQTRIVQANAKTTDEKEEHTKLSEEEIKLQPNLVRELATAIVAQGKLPTWTGELKTTSQASLMQHMAQKHAKELVVALQQIVLTAPVVDRLMNHLTFADLAQSIVAKDSNLKGTLSMLRELYDIAPLIQIPGIDDKLLQTIIYSKTIKALQSNNWRSLNPKYFLQELIWLLIRDHHLQNSKILNALELHRHLLPSPMVMSLTAMLAAERQKKQVDEIQKQLEEVAPEQEEEVGASYPVTNAGIVIIQSFLPMLFNRLKLIDGKSFVSDEAQQKAVHAIQFLATGQTTTDEHHLTLNKLLCGMPMSAPVQNSITLTDSERETCNGLLQAAIGYWTAIGDSSPDGFRGNWLIRDGVLTVDEDRYNLDVEKRAYDILLNQSPFTFSIIKHHWMETPVHVAWSY